MPTATLDVDPDVYLSIGRTFLDVNDTVCDIVVAAAQTANSAHGMAGADSVGVDWAHAYDAAASSLLRAGSTVVDALGVVGDRLTATGGNHDAADTASVPRGGARPPSYSGSSGTTRAVSAVVSTPPSADGTPDDPPPGWSLIAHLVASTWPAGRPDQLRGVGAGWLKTSLTLSEQADRLSGPIAELAGQSSPEIPYALSTCTGLQTAMRTVADQCAVLAHACTGYGNYLDRTHRDVISELVELVADEAAIQAAGAIAAGPTGGLAEVPAQSVAASRLTVSALRIARILTDLAAGVVALQSLVQGVAEHVIGVLLTLHQVTAQREMLQAVTALIDAGIPPIDLQANEHDNPDAHVIDRHVAKSDSYLISRNKFIASTFTSLAAATTAVSTVIAANGPEIAAWLAGTDRELPLSGALQPGAGRCYVRKSGRFVPATQLKLTLLRNSNGYYIVTAFPVP